jgi:hypothetical protein
MVAYRQDTVRQLGEEFIRLLLACDQALKGSHESVGEPGDVLGERESNDAGCVDAIGLDLQVSALMDGRARDPKGQEVAG